MTNTESSVIRFIRKISIRTRLYSVQIFFTLSVLVVVALLLNYYTRYIVFNQNDTFTQNYIEQLMTNVDYVMTQNAVALTNAATDVKLYDSVNEYYDTSTDEQYKRTAVIRNILDKVRESTNKFCGAEVCTIDSRIASLQTPITTGDINTSAILKRVGEENALTYFGTRKPENDYPTKMVNKYVIISAPIQSRAAKKPVGYVSVAFSEALLYQIINTDRFSEKTLLYISDADGNIISHPNKSKLGTKEDPGITASASGGGGDDLRVRLDEKDYYLNSTSSSITNWKVVALTDYNMLMNDLTSSLLRGLIPLMAFVIIIAFISFIVSKSIVGPIGVMVEKMKILSVDGMYPSVPIEGKDEFTYMEREFNAMSQRIKALLKQTKEASEKQSKAQMKALQAQISPHFLYNTLDAVNWMAYIAENYEICDIVNDLSGFFRISLNFGKEIFTVSDEIEHVSCYCKIQQHRFGDKMKFVLDVDSDTLNYKMLKIILQPLVENAVSHGLAPKDYCGAIVISVKEEDDILIMRVTDDGVGLSYWDQHARTSEKHSGYGISNVNERIKLYFGDEYGIRLYENSPCGTIAELRVPALKEEPEID